jgi:hypothetical protein
LGNVVLHLSAFNTSNLKLHALIPQISAQLFSHKRHHGHFVLSLVYRTRSAPGY